MVERLMMWLSSKLILAVIIILAFLIRVVYVDSQPVGLTWDEASLGYNAYSILKTGKDEYGTPFPLIFKSFGDYKPGLYVYLTVPFVALFDLNEMAVRLPSVILGTLIPLLGYLITKELLGKKYEYAAICVALLLALSPWLIHFSRGAWEANVALFETLLAVFLFLKSRQGNRLLFFLAILFFGLSIYTYQSAKLFSLIILIGLIFLYRNTFLQKNYRAFMGALVIAFLVTLISSLADPIVRSRLTVLNQYSYKRSEQELSLIKQEENKLNNFEFQLFHSENLEYLRTVSTRYLGYFSPKFLFMRGAQNGREGLIDYGAMQLFEAPLLLIGLYSFLRLKIGNKGVILLWLMAAPLSAALSRDILNTVRALPLAFGLEFIAGFGLFTFIGYLLKNKKLLLLPILGVFISVSLLSIGFYLDKYYVHANRYASQYWLYGHKEAIQYVEENKYKYDQVVFTNKFNQPYIFYLFYTKYDPAKYQKQSVLISKGPDVGEVPRIDNIEFRALNWPQDRSIKNTLYVGWWLEIPDQDIDPKQSKLLKVINFYDSAVAFKIAETNKQ